MDIVAYTPSNFRNIMSANANSWLSMNHFINNALIGALADIHGIHIHPHYGNANIVAQLVAENTRFLNNIYLSTLNTNNEEQGPAIDAIVADNYKVDHCLYYPIKPLYAHSWLLWLYNKYKNKRSNWNPLMYSNTNYGYNKYDNDIYEVDEAYSLDKVKTYSLDRVRPHPKSTYTEVISLVAATNLAVYALAKSGVFIYPIINVNFDIHQYKELINALNNYLQMLNYTDVSEVLGPEVLNHEEPRQSGEYSLVGLFFNENGVTTGCLGRYPSLTEAFDAKHKAGKDLRCSKLSVIKTSVPSASYRQKLEITA